jgi:hypothetical protein
LRGMAMRGPYYLRGMATMMSGCVVVVESRPCGVVAASSKGGTCRHTATKAQGSANAQFSPLSRSQLMVNAEQNAMSGVSLRSPPSALEFAEVLEERERWILPAIWHFVTGYSQYRETSQNMSVEEISGEDWICSGSIYAARS